MTYSPNNFSQSAPAAQRTSNLVANNTGSTINQASAVYSDSTGIHLIDPSVEAQAQGIVGVTSTNISTGTNGQIVSNGTILNISTSASIQDVMYVQKNGSLGNTKPSIGVGGFLAGDWIIKVGVITMNTSNALLKDLTVTIQVIAQL